MKNERIITLKANNRDATKLLGCEFANYFAKPLVAAPTSSCVVSVFGSHLCGKTKLMRAVAKQFVPDCDSYYKEKHNTFQNASVGVFGQKIFTHVDLGKDTCPTNGRYTNDFPLFRKAVSCDYGFSAQRTKLTPGIVVVEHSPVSITLDSDVAVLMANPEDSDTSKSYFEKMLSTFSWWNKNFYAQKNESPEKANALQVVAEQMQQMNRLTDTAATGRFASFILLSEEPKARQRFQAFRQRVSHLGFASA